MRYFITTQAEILRVSGLHPTYDAGVVARDLDRTQIPGPFYSPVSQDDLDKNSTNSSSTESIGETDSEVSTISEDSLPDREEFELFFKSVFEVLKERLPYNQGMMTGSIVSQILINEYMKRDSEEFIKYKGQTLPLSFCFKANNGTWQGIHLEMNLQKKTWYAAITNFNTSKGVVAILGEGPDYQKLKTQLNGEEMHQVSELRDLIQNEDVKRAVSQLPMIVEPLRRKNADPIKTFKEAVIKFYRQCGSSVEQTNNIIKRYAEKVTNLQEEYQTRNPQAESQPPKSFFSLRK